MVDGFVKQRGHYHLHPVQSGVFWSWSKVARCTYLSLTDRSHSLFPSCLICSLLCLQANSLYTLFNLSSPCLLCPSSHLLPIHCKHHSFYTVIILSSNHMSNCPYYLTPFAFAIMSNVFKPSISFNFSLGLCFLSTNFTPHIDLTMALSVLLTIAISISLKHLLRII